jgi:hypothetical protein
MFHANEEQIILVLIDDNIRNSMNPELLYVHDELIAGEGNNGCGRVEYESYCVPRPEVVVRGWNLEAYRQPSRTCSSCRVSAEEIK